MLIAGRIDTYIAYEDRPQLPDPSSPNQQDPAIIKAEYSEKVSNSALIAISKTSPLNNELVEIENEILTMITDGSLLRLWQLSNPNRAFPYPLITYPHYTRPQHSEP